MNKKPVLKEIPLYGDGFIVYRIFFQFSKIIDDYRTFIGDNSHRDKLKELLNEISHEVLDIWQFKKEYKSILTKNIQEIDDALGSKSDTLKYKDESTKLHNLFKNIIVNSVIILRKTGILCGILFDEDINSILGAINYMKGNTTNENLLDMLQSDNDRLKYLNDLRSEFEHPKNKDVKLFDFIIEYEQNNEKPLLVLPSIQFKNNNKRQINEYIEETSINLFSFIEDMLGAYFNIFFEKKKIPIILHRVLPVGDQTDKESYQLHIKSTE